jgi:hypothetical protein
VRKTLIASSFAGCICLICCQSVGAVPAAPVVVKEAAIGSSTVQQAQYYQRHKRHRIIKCYRELVIGPYVCHSFHRWWL